MLPGLRAAHAVLLGQGVDPDRSGALLPEPPTSRHPPAATHPSLRYTVATMRRSAVLLLMLFAMLWQSVALARVGSTVNALTDLEHAALHWQDKSHHHHHDGSYHLDDSNDAAKHVLNDHVTATNAFLVTTLHSFQPLGSAAPSGLRKPHVTDPPPDGLLRPPRART